MIVIKYTIVPIEEDFLLKLNYQANRVIGFNTFRGTYSLFCSIPGPRYIGVAKEQGVTSIIKGGCTELVIVPPNDIFQKL